MGKNESGKADVGDRRIFPPDRKKEHVLRVGIANT